MMKTTFILLLMILLLPTCFAQKPAWANDFEEVFTKQQLTSLNHLLSKHEKKTSNEVVIVSIINYESFESLFDFSMDLAKKWGIGKSYSNNGVLFTFGKEIREARILVGFGLEDKLTDVECEIILNKVIIPKFKKGKYYQGTKKGMKKLLKEIK